MRIWLNGKPHDLGDGRGTETLAGLLAEMGLPDAQVATAVNGLFVPRGARAETRLGEGDAVEVLRPMEGG